MPVDWSKYPKDWKQISLSIRGDRAQWQCEWSDEKRRRCLARHGEPHPVTDSKVVLTVAHLDHDTTNSDLDNLMAMCQLHHNRYDVGFRTANKKRKREANSAST